MNWWPVRCAQEVCVWSLMCCKRLLTLFCCSLCTPVASADGQTAHLCPSRHAGHGRGGAAVSRRVRARPLHARVRHPLVLLHLAVVLEPLPAAGRRCPSCALTVGERSDQPAYRCAHDPLSERRLLRMAMSFARTAHLPPPTSKVAGRAARGRGTMSFLCNRAWGRSGRWHRGHGAGVDMHSLVAGSAPAPSERVVSGRGQ